MVVTSLIDLILVMFGETIKWTRVLRVLRVMRPLRMVKYNEGMRVVIDAVIMCAPRMRNTSGVSSFTDSNTNNTRMLVRKTCIVLYFIHGPLRIQHPSPPPRAPAHS